MKTYVGTDIIEVDRIKKAMEDSNFIYKVFTDKEIEYCELKSNSIKYQNYAARFAAKEAVYKAISKQLKDKYDISWKNIEITNEENGRPTVTIVGKEIKNIDIDISLSHIKEYAIATAVINIY